jgi:bacterial/archaeal transporter family protein
MTTETLRGSYVFWALLSALFAGLTALWGKRGIEGVPSNLAVAVRLVVVLTFAIGIVLATKQTNLSVLNGRALWFLSLSGLATGASWLCYFRALQLGEVSRVAPIDKLSFVLAMALGILFLKEKPSANLLGGAALIVAGVLLTLRR